MSMILPLHILIAVASILFTSYVLIAPSQTKLRVSYGLVALTLTSGTALVVSSPAHMMQACTSGILYVSFVTMLIIVASRKLSRQTPTL